MISIPVRQCILVAVKLSTPLEDRNSSKLDCGQDKEAYIQMYSPIHMTCTVQVVCIHMYNHLCFSLAL